jgi:hypothetical protein
VAYGIEYDVPAPVEFYDAVHTEALRRVGSAVDGLRFHIGRPDEGGFQVIEVWESREHWQRYNDEVDEVIGPVTAQLAGGRQPEAADAVPSGHHREG